MAMIGTSYEMLLYFSHLHSTGLKLGFSPTRMYELRKRIKRMNYGEDTIIEYLKKLDCTCVREKVLVPAIIRDKKGRIFDEITFTRLYLSEDIAKDICRKQRLSDTRWLYVRKGMLTDRALKIFLKTKGAHKVQERVVLPSVWKYDPFYEITDRLSDYVGRIIGAE